MADERQELDRLRKLKRLRELEAKSTTQGDQNVNISSNNLVVRSDNKLAIEQGQPVAQQQIQKEKGFFDGVSEFFTGSERETRATRELPEIGQGGLLFGEDKFKVAALTPALLTSTNPEEIAKILKGIEGIGITSDEKGNLIANNNKTGVKVVLNQPGFSQLDVMQALGLAAAFTPAGRLVGAGRIATGAGVTSAGVEALQALSGGDFDASQVAIDTVTAGVLDKAFEVAKATGRSIRDVLKNDAKIDPNRILKDFSPKGFKRQKFAKKEVTPKEIPETIRKATQADLTHEALKKIRQAESQGIQLTKAQATGDFAANEAEQTLLGGISEESVKSRAFAEKQQEQLKDAAKSFTDKFGGSSRFTESIGEFSEITSRTKGAQIQEALKEVKELNRKEVSDLYTIAGETAGTPVPLANDVIVNKADEVMNILPVSKEVRETIDTALAKFGLVGDSVEPITRNINAVIDGKKRIEIVGDVTPLTLSNAAQFRKQLNKAVGADITGAAKSVVNNLDDQVRIVINEGAESGRTDAFSIASDAAAKQFETFKASDVIQELVSFKKGTKTAVIDPETVISKIVKGDKAVTNIRKIKKILLENPTEKTKRAWRSIQAESIGDILSQSINKDTLKMSGSKLNSAIKKYRPEALRELLGKKQFAELKRLQQTIGSATIPPPGTTNPSGTFTKALIMMERLGNFGGSGNFGFGTLVATGVKKGKEIATRKKTLDGIVNTKIETLKARNPKMSRSSLEKAAKALAFLEIRELDKENK